MTEMPADMDGECLALCQAINSIDGLETIQSCCGHGEKPFRIWFRCKDLNCLPKLLYFIDRCHVSLGKSWKCFATTDCAMSPVIFVLESSIIGEVANQEANLIAKEILEN